MTFSRICEYTVKIYLNETFDFNDETRVFG